MTTNTHIRKTDSTGSRTYHGDGLLDIMVGIGVITLAAAFAAGMPWMAGIFPATFVPVWRDARKKLTDPRLARYGIRTGSDKRAMMLIALTTLAGGLGLVLGLIAFLLTRNDMVPAWLGLRRELIPIGIIGGLSLGLLILAGFTLEGSRRYLVYAGWMAILLLLTVVLGLGPAVPMFGAGFLMLTGGLIVLANFLRRYPL